MTLKHPILHNAKNYKKALIYFGIAILIIDILAVSYFRFLERFELVTFDFRYNLRLAFPQRVNPDIVIIEIAEDTLTALGRWPLPRDYHAKITDVLKGFGAKEIIFDILFCEPSNADGLIVKSAKEAGNVYFPFAFRLAQMRKKGVLEATDVDAPILEDFKDASKGVGFINKTADPDGKVRRAPIFIKFKGRLYPSMVAKAACDYLGADPNSVSFEGKKNRFRLKDFYIPVDENGLVLLNFAGRWADTFKHYSYFDILAAFQEISDGRKPRIDPNELKGKVCFIGLTAIGTQELGPIPIESAYPMVGVHANLFNLMTEKAYMARLGRIGNLAILIIFCLVLLFLMNRIRPYQAFFMSLGMILLIFVSSILLFIFKGVWIDMVCPIVILLCLYIGVTLTRYIGEMRVRERMQKELAVATIIQQCFLPAEIPSLEGLDIAVEMKTAKEVGGDLYDFLKLGEGRLGVMIGDVSGKGVPAALFMSKIETLFRVYSKNETQPSKVLANLNNEVSHDERSGLFTTLAYVIFDIEKKQLLFSDGGHLPLIMSRSNGASMLTSEDGMAVGIMEDAVFSDKVVPLAKGDVLIFYTDGISEARDIQENEFGVERLIDLVNRLRTLSAKDMVNKILAELKLFQGKALQHDDITIIVIKVY